MSSGLLVLRRFVLLALLLALGAAAFQRVRGRRSTGPAPAPQWPPFEPRIVPAVPLADGWLVPDASGTPPDGYPVKVKISSGIFHVPGGRFYERTSPDRCYPSAAAAEADGYRPSKS
jgi:hypothetical protein